MKKFYQQVKVEVKSGQVIEFIMTYWLEIISYKGERMKRFKFMPENSNVRIVYSDTLNKYDIDKSYCRFYNENQKIRTGNLNDMNGSENIMVFYGLRLKQMIENQFFSNSFSGFVADKLKNVA